MTLSVVRDADETWAQRRGRRTTDAPVPNTREVFGIADAIRTLVLADNPYATFSAADRAAVEEIIRWMPRTDDIRFALGLPGDGRTS